MLKVVDQTTYCTSLHDNPENGFINESCRAITWQLSKVILVPLSPVHHQACYYADYIPTFNKEHSYRSGMHSHKANCVLAHQMDS